MLIIKVVKKVEPLVRHGLRTSSLLIEKFMGSFLSGLEGMFHGKAAVTIALTAVERAELEGLAGRRRTAQGVGASGAYRSCGGGRLGEQGRSRKSDADENTVSKWGAAGLASGGTTGFTTSRVPGRRGGSATMSRRDDPATVMLR
jgi:hypothetical protein